MSDIPGPLVASVVALSLISIPSAIGAEKPVHVELKNAHGEVIGSADLSPAKQGVRIKLRASKLSPGLHGIHFHEKGLCEGPDFKSAGGHLNPDKKEHGLENPKGSHAGDMPNIEASRSGTVRKEFVVRGVTLSEGVNSLKRLEGAALVIHSKADDQKSNPAGDSGDRIACGVIPAPMPTPTMTLAPEAAPKNEQE